MLHGMAFTGDAIKFQFVGPTAGTGHETGNPVYLMLIWPLSKIPIGDIGTRVNAASALFMVLACAIFFLILRELHVRHTIAAAFSIGLGLVPGVLLYAVVAEVHSLHLAFVTAILLALALWEKYRTDRYLYLLVVFVALSLGNHLTTILLVPGILAFLWMVDRENAFTARTAAAAAAGVAGAMSLYFYLVWRAADASVFYLEITPDSFGDLVDIWLGGRYRGVFFNVDPTHLVTVLVPYVFALLAVSFAALAPLIVVGFKHLTGTAIRITLTWWAVFTLLLVFLIGNGGVGVGWVEPYLIPVAMLLAVFAAVGAEQIALRHVRSKIVESVVLAGLVFLMAAPFVPVLGWADRSEETVYQEEVRSWLRELPGDAVLASSYQEAMAAWYMMAIEHIETDVEVLHIDGYDIDADWFTVLDDYLLGQPGYTWQLRQIVEAGKDVYAPTDSWMCVLVEEGFALTPYRPGIYRVVAERGAHSFADRATQDMRDICARLD
jgi:hypothetical protein